MPKFTELLKLLIEAKPIMDSICKPDTSVDDQIANLKIDIAERSKVYTWICKSYSEAKVKILTFIGGDLAVLTFLYADGKTFIPRETYGRIFYFSALGLTIFGLGLLFWALKPRYWEFPVEDRDLEKINTKTEAEYLSYVQERYIYCCNVDLKVYEEKQRLLNTSFYPLLIGATILIVIKLFIGAHK